MITDITHLSFGVMYQNVTMKDIYALLLWMTYRVYVLTWLYLTNRKVNRRSVKVMSTVKTLYTSLTMIASIMHQSSGVIQQETTMKDL